MPRPFRFGVQIHDLPPQRWRERIQRIEALGYSSILMPDHFGPQWDPIATLGAVAAVSEELRIGSLVYDIDYRHPVVLAKASATLHLLSGGRVEFGLGAGWMRSDYEQAGIRYDAPSIRIQRLDEALQIIRSMWTQETTSFEGEHFHIRDIAQAAPLPAGERPKILVGGGKKRVLGVAGRHADIVGINPSLEEGRVTRRTAGDLAPERVRQKIEWVRAGAESAGRSLDDIELNSLVFMVAVTPDPKPLREGLASNTDMTIDQVADCPLFLVGSPQEIRDQLERRREQTGISYVVIQGDDEERLETFAAEIVSPLAGN